VTPSLLLRAIQHVHGHLGWLGIAALLHPAIILRDPRRRARLAVVLATAFISITGAIGMGIYPEYRVRVRPILFRDAPHVAAAFERKEHLAIAVIAFAWIGCIAHLVAPSLRERAAELAAARLAHLAFVLAAILALVVGILGVIVASTETF
jgi:hypothetical protein